MIVYINNLQTDLPIDSKKVEQVARRVVLFEDRSYDEVSIQFVDTEHICSLHEEYFADPSPTDCISFPMDEEENRGESPRILGDVILCPETAINYAKAHDGDFYEELTLYLVHGLLHLMGYKDIEEEEIQEMRAAEERHMKNLKKLDICLNS